MRRVALAAQFPRPVRVLCLRQAITAAQQRSNEQRCLAGSIQLSSSRSFQLSADDAENQHPSCQPGWARKPMRDRGIINARERQCRRDFSAAICPRQTDAKRTSTGSAKSPASDSSIQCMLMPSVLLSETVPQSALKTDCEEGNSDDEHDERWRQRQVITRPRQRRNEPMSPGPNRPSISEAGRLHVARHIRAVPRQIKRAENAASARHRRC